MINEYLKRSKSVVKWLVPFALAVFLLFGCSNGEAARTSGQTTGQTAAAEQFEQLY